MEVKLNGRVALVTGSGRGIGKAIALALSESGATIVLNDIDLERVRKVSEQIVTSGKRAMPLQTDVSQRKEVEQMVRTAIDSLGKIDILVNNAGIIVRKPMEDYTEDDWDRVINVNLKGVFNLSHAVGKGMIAQRFGRIVNIASIMGDVALPPRASYSASKGGIISLTKDLAAEWAKYNITVNSISPGWTVTEMTETYFGQEEVRKFLLERIPVSRFGLPEEIADLAVFLASEKSGYITGQNIFVDGGWTAQ